MRQVALLLFLMVLSRAGVSQQLTATIRGKITDNDTKQPLGGVNIFILNTNPPQGAVSNSDGSFILEKTTVGRISLRFSYVGYEEKIFSELLVTSGRETFLNIEMHETVSNMTEVVVTDQKDKSKANNDFAPVSARSFSAEEMTRYAGTQNDPARMAQSFAGVVTADDENNQIIVRGNSPRGLLWRLEGIEIPNPNHFAGSEGSTGGGVSILSANMLTNTDFFSGAFAAEYGNALSGVFDLNLRKGNSNKWEFTLKAGVLGAELNMEGPFSKKYKGSYLLNYRYSTLELFALMGFDIGGNVTPKYQDMCFNFYFPSKKAGAFTVFGLGGMSSLGEKAKRDTSTWKTFSDKVEYGLKQTMGVAGVTHLLLLKDTRSYLKTVVSYSYTDNSNFDDSLDYQFRNFNLSNDKFVYKTLRATTAINSKLNSKNSLRAGIVYSWVNYKLLRDKYSFVTQQINRLVNNEGHTHLLQGYVQWKRRFSEKFQLNSGVHLTFSFLNNKLYIEPRLSAEYKINEHHTLSFGTGLHSRMDAVSTYVTVGGKNLNLDFSRALHVVGGYNFSFLRDFRLKAEVYAQYIFNVPVANSSTNNTFSILNYNDGFVSETLTSNGSGYNYGLELTLEKYFSKHYFFMFTTSLFNSEYKAADGKWRSTAYNVNYVLNALGGKEFVVGKKKNNIIGVNAKIIWRGGQRYTPVDLVASRAANETVYETGKAFSEKLPDYFRVDFSVSFRRNKKKYSWEISVDAQNIINRKNVARVVYNPDTQQIEKKRNLGAVPVFSWKIEFGVYPKAK